MCMCLSKVCAMCMCLSEVIAMCMCLSKVCAMRMCLSKVCALFDTGRPTKHDSMQDDLNIVLIFDKICCIYLST